MNFKYYVPPSEYVLYTLFGILFSSACIVEKYMPFDIEIPDIDLPSIPFDLSLPDIDLPDITLPDIDFELPVLGSYNPFLNFEPVNACCETGTSLVGTTSFVGCTADGAPCAACKSSNACFTCKPLGGECTTGSDCCQYSSNRKNVNYCDTTGEKGICAEQRSSPIGTLLDKFCVAYNDGNAIDSVALGFEDGIPPFTILPGFPSIPSKRLFPSACFLHDGLASKTPQGLYAISLKLLGIGVSTSDRLSYGANYWTQSQGTNDNLNKQVPPVWDGFVDVELPEQGGFDFWLAARFIVQKSALWKLNEQKCKGVLTKELPEVSGKDKALSLNVDFELYADVANTDSPCVLLTMPSATIKLLIFEFRIGRGIGGFCTNPDPCAPSGFFANIESRLEGKGLATVNVLSALGSIFSGLTDAGNPFKDDDPVDLSGGLSLGVRVEESSPDPTSVFLRIELPSLKLFGLSVGGPQSLVHFQWFVGSELERRRWSILRPKPNVFAPSNPNCADTVSGCTVWKPYLGYDGDKWEICEDLLLGLEPYNQVMMVSTNPKNSVDFPIRLNGGKTPDAWYFNEIYGPSVVEDGDDFFVAQLGIATWDLGIVKVSDLYLIVIANVGNDSVYINANLGLTVLWLANFKASAAIQNFCQ